MSAIDPTPLPLAILIDYDGTICRTAVSDEIMIEDSIRPGWKVFDDMYVDGSLGSRQCFIEFLPLLPAEPEALFATADRQDHDLSFIPFVERALEVGAALEIVSDGLGFYVGRNLARIGVPDLPIATARMTWSDTGPDLEFTYGHPACFVCGTCKRERVLHYQARGFHVAFVGDGLSDRYAAAHADTVVAKDHLVGICEETGVPYVPWRTFDDLTTWLDRVVADPGSLAAPRKRPYTCGPEVWGPGRTVPPLVG